MIAKSSTLLLALLFATSSVLAATIAPGNSSSSEETVEIVDQEEEVEDSALEASLESFLNLVPTENIRNVSAEAYLESEAVRESFNFLRSREFLDAKDRLLEAPEAQEFIKFLNQSGLNVTRFVRKVSNLTGIPATILNGEEMNLSGSSEEGLGATVLTQLVDKVLAELPQEQFFTIFFEKMESDSDFSEFVERLNGDEFEAILLKVQVRWKIFQIR